MTKPRPVNTTGAFEMNEKSSCPVLRGRDGGNTILLLDLDGCETPMAEGGPLSDPSLGWLLVSAEEDT